MTEPTLADEKAARHLAEIEEIKKVKARYFRCMDTRDWAGMREVFAADIVMDMQAEMKELVRAGIPADVNGGIIKGRDTVIESMSTSLMGTVTVHHGHMPEITLLSDNDATAIWAFEDIIKLAAGGPHKQFHGFGHYHERYIRDRDARWRMSSTRITRLMRDIC